MSIKEYVQAAMNTIPTTFNDSAVSYTAVGGEHRKSSTGLSAVLLNRGGRYLRRSVFQELEKAGFDYVISIESPRENYDIEELSIRFPFVRFILLSRAISVGEQINLAAAEVPSSHFFVLWNDSRLISGGGAERMAERLAGREEKGNLDVEKLSFPICQVPLIQNSHFETLPTLIAPAFFRSSIKAIPFSTGKEGMPSLYPFDAVGLYSKDKFIRLGGYDASLSSTFWQLMDFGFRAHLWGESILSTQLIKVVYDGDPPAGDATVEESHKRFYLKNLAPIFRGDCVHLPWRRFLPYWLRSNTGPLEARSEFKAARDWVETNRFRFVCDARKVLELWETPE